MKLEHKKYSLVATEEQPNFSLELLSSTLLTKELLDSSTKTSIKLSVQRDTRMSKNLIRPIDMLWLYEEKVDWKTLC